jgi:hypothetical protein
MLSSNDYKVLATFVLVVALSYIQYYQRSSHQISTTMASNELVISLSNAKLLPSRVIPKDFTPSVELFVTFDTKKVENGNLLRVGDVKSAPNISFSAPVSAAFTHVPKNLQFSIVTCWLSIYS